MTVHSSPICVISSHPLAATFLLNVLRAEYSKERIVSEGCLEASGEHIQPLFILDRMQLPLPLSEHVSRLSARFPRAFFIVVDLVRNESEIPYMLSLGVHGFVAHDQVQNCLVQAAESIMAGGVWAPQRALRAQHLPAYQHRSGARACEPTHREMQVLELVRRRFSNKEIGDLLRIRESTVKYHVSNLFGKLEVTSRLELGRSQGTLH